MLTFLKLSVEGFCSIDKVELPLNQNCTMLIKAPNGSGKSTLFSSLVWGLYGKNLKGKPEVTTWEKIRPKGYQGVKVEVFFQNGSKLYKIVRCQSYQGNLDDGSKGKDRLLFYEDSELVNIKGKLQLQDKIVKSIGFSYNLFISSIMFGQGLKRLVQETNTDKKKIFEEVFDIGFVNEAKLLAQSHKNGLDEEYKELSRDINTLEDNIETLEETYGDLKSKEKEERKELLQLRSKFNKAKGEYEAKLSNLKYDPKELDAINNKIAKIKAIKRDTDKSIGISMEDLVDKLYHTIKNKEYSKALGMVTTLKEAYTTINDCNTKLSKYHDKLDGLYQLRSSYNSLVSKIDDLKSDLNTVKEDLEALKTSDNKGLTSKYKKKIASKKKSLETLRAKLDDLKPKIDDYQWLIQDPLGNNGIKAYLFDSSLIMVNEALSRYTNILGFKIEFSIDLESTRKDFVTLIERDNTIIDYDELSGGEKQLINVAMAFAMNEVLTASRGINLAFLDEIFESLSQDNIEVVISLIKFLFEDKTLFLITHHESLPLSNTKVLSVEKSKGLSSYRVL